MGVLVAVGAAAQIAVAIREVVTTIEAIAGAIERSVVLRVENDTDLTFRLRDARDPENGGFAVPPSAEIPPRTADIFGAHSTGFLTGTKGSLQYEATDPGSSVLFQVKWDNPWAGGNSCEMLVYQWGAVPAGSELIARIMGWPGWPQEDDEYTGTEACGGGNRNAEMRYRILRK